MAGDDWSREEVEATVGDYFAMLRDELAGLPVNKSERNLRLRRLLQNRSKGSVEFKHANISAVLTLHGYPYIDGYKPRFNFQALLEQVVLEYLDVHRDFFEPLVTGPVLNPTTSPDPATLDTARLVERPPEAMRIPQTVWSPTTRLSRFDFVARDAANRDLGRRGEEFVVEFERKRLHDGGRRDLVQRIEWTAQVRGDGAGYDVQSFNADGSTRLIEVKTTGLGKYFPFNVTVNEVRCSEARPEGVPALPRLQLRTGRPTVHASGRDFRILPPRRDAISCVRSIHPAVGGFGLSLAIEQPNERLGVAERVVDRMMIVLRSAQTLPLLRAAEITDQPSVEVGDASAGVPERVLAEVAPEVEVDPLEVVGRVVRDEHDRHPRCEPLAELAERVLGAVRAVERLGAPVSKRVDVDGAELRHVAHRRRADAERRFAVNNDQSSHRASPWTPATE